MTERAPADQDAAEAYRVALQAICEQCDRVRQLALVDAYRDGLKDAWSEARSIAAKALTSQQQKTTIQG